MQVCMLHNRLYTLIPSYINLGYEDRSEKLRSGQLRSGELRSRGLRSEQLRSEKLRSGEKITSAH